MRKSFLLLAGLSLLALPVLVSASASAQDSGMTNTNGAMEHPQGSGTMANGSPVGGNASNPQSPASTMSAGTTHATKHVKKHSHKKASATSTGATSSGNSESGTTMQQQ